jgi:hypothetical protein
LRPCSRAQPSRSHSRHRMAHHVDGRVESRLARTRGRGAGDESAGVRHARGPATSDSQSLGLRAGGTAFHTVLVHYENGVPIRGSSSHELELVSLEQVPPWHNCGGRANCWPSRPAPRGRCVCGRADGPPRGFTACGAVHLAAAPFCVKPFVVRWTSSSLSSSKKDLAGRAYWLSG